MSREEKARLLKARRKAARRALAEADTGAKPNHDQRRMQSSAGTRKRPARRRRPDVKHIVIAVSCGVAVMAMVGATLGLVPAIEAAGRNGTIGTFVVSNQPCLVHRGGCAYTGTFDAVGGEVFSHVAYVGILPPGAGGGARIPARYTGYQQAYPLHGSRSWVVDLGIMALIGGVAALLVWLLPVGLGKRSVWSSSALR